MIKLTKTLAIAGLALSATVAAPAIAQVQGRVGTASISRAIQSTTALQNAYSQVNQTYTAQIQTAQTKQGELSELLKPFDTDGNGEINETESAALQAAPNFSQIQTLQREIASINDQVTAARVYAVEQVLVQYPTALQEVATQTQVQMVVDPASLQYAVEEADITPLVTTALNAKVPTVGIVPPNGWRPGPNTLQVFQEIQRRALIQQIRDQQAQQQNQQQSTQQQAPAGR